MPDGDACEHASATSVSPAAGLIPVKQKPASLPVSCPPLEVPPSDPDDDPDDPDDDPDEDPDPPSAALVVLAVQAAMFAELAAAAISVAVPESTHIFFVEIIGTTSLSSTALHCTARATLSRPHRGPKCTDAAGCE